MGANLTTKALAWEVRLPGKRVSELGGKRPRGMLVLRSGEPDEESLTLPLAVARLLDAKQKAGEVHPESRAELLYVTRELARTCAAARVERLVDRRDYSTDELRTKLRLDGYSRQVIDDCVSHAREIGLVDDHRYADVYVRSKVAAGWGMVRIERELGRRGVDVQELEGWPYAYLDPDDELERAREVARTKRVNGARPYEKLVRYLCARGYSMGVARRAARETLDEREDA